MEILKKLETHFSNIPDHIAMISGKNQLTYKALWQKSNALSVAIDARLGENKAPVVVYGHKSPFILICFFASLKSGRAYIPIDTSVPKSRVDSIVRQSQTQLILAVEPYQYDNAVQLHEIEEMIQQNDGKNLPESYWIKDDDLYYILFTSGSTGEPKGVQITQNCVANFLDWALTIGHTDKTGQVFINQAPFSFDLSVYELTMSLASGGTLFCLTKELLSSPKDMLSAFEHSNANVWVSTPSFADICLANDDYCEKLMPKLELFIFCGETLTNHTAALLMSRFPNAKIINTYGPTESTVAVTEVLITPQLNQTCTPLPVGTAKPGTVIQIVNDRHIPVPDGEKGEIRIAGDTVSTGYLHRPDLSEKVFGDCEIDGKFMRCYYTGDEGYLKDGMLYYGGRIDLQVKLNGYRIELEEIESKILSLDYVRNAVVIPYYKEGKVSYLAAFVVLKQAIAETDFKEALAIKQTLKISLPQYMIPKKFIFKPAIPMTNNGKADRKKLAGELV